MYNNKPTFGFVVGLTSLILTSPVMAYEAGDWLVRGRIVHLAPNDDSGNIYLNTGSGSASINEGVAVNSDTIPELDITYMISRHWGVELILGYSEHRVRGDKSNVAFGPVADTKVLPPTLTLQYHFAPDSDIRPYLGAGINYTYFFDEKVPNSSALSAPGDSVSLDSSWGLAVQAGVDIAINEDWFLNLDLKYIDIDTEAHYSDILSPGVKATVNADIDPLVWGVGIGRRF